jgi:2-keto-4-pentenoate hydratase/2-oxohepta-3-ene-1,7-dioic acid hydratase in catechol pathway
MSALTSTWQTFCSLGVGYFRDPRVALRSRDTVEVEVEGIGKLTNPVVG